MDKREFHFGDLLKNTLKILNLRYKDLLDLMNTDYYLDLSIVSKWSRGISKPSRKHLDDIIKALCFKVQELRSKGYTILLDKLVNNINEYIGVSDLPQDTKSNLLKIQEAEVLLEKALELSFYLENNQNTPSIEAKDNKESGNVETHFFKDNNGSPIPIKKCIAFAFILIIIVACITKFADKPQVVGLSNTGTADGDYDEIITFVNKETIIPSPVVNTPSDSVKNEKCVSITDSQLVEPTDPIQLDKALDENEVTKENKENNNNLSNNSTSKKSANKVEEDMKDDEKPPFNIEVNGDNNNVVQCVDSNVEIN